MKVYLVGGAVRDELLGLPVKERDYVVVGATPEEMVKQGFKPVGKDFPVFLHPRTHEEHALARTERKSGRGYKGFKVYASPEVTLEEDLKRRDLTINAMAKAEDGTLIDPFGGAKDLKAQVLRHVSEAFAEDPVRILRVARFAARFGFKVADETMRLMRVMVDAGESDYLVPERVWQEFSRGLAEKHPEKMFEVLDHCGFLEKNLPELKPLPTRFSGSIPMRFALLVWPHDRQRVDSLTNKLRTPSDVRDFALAAISNRDDLKNASKATPPRLLEVLTRADAFRRPERFAELLKVAEMADPSIDTARVEGARRAAASVNAGAIAKKAKSTAETSKLIQQARIDAIAKAL